MSLFKHESENFDTAVGFKSQKDATKSLLSIMVKLAQSESGARSLMVEETAKEFGLEDNQQAVYAIATAVKLTEALMKLHRSDEEEEQGEDQSSQIDDYEPS